MPTECNPELCLNLHLLKDAGLWRRLMAGQSPRILERCCWVRRIERSG
jgi:hypothetical protein